MEEEEERMRRRAILDGYIFLALLSKRAPQRSDTNSYIKIPRKTSIQMR
jgi:hypothetical protein